ncbi:MAG: amidohydrolase [Chloroflexi bacterium]|nr:amidohydrolase [Chloroflexota bacterium]
MTHEYVVLHGGTVLTLDACAPSDAASRALGAPDAAGRRATAVAFAHDRILAVGTDANVLAIAGPDSTVIDLRGGIVVPGFIDPHAHPLGEGVDAGKVLIGGEPDLRAALRRLSDAASRLDPDAWLLARYDQTRWLEPRHPTRDDLDRAIPDRPVLLAHVSGHAVAVNSLALALAGVGPATDDVAGRWSIERDVHGEPTGVVVGTDAWSVFEDAVPPPTTAGLTDAVVRAGRRLAADGVVATADADLGSDGTRLEAALRAYVAAAASGGLAQVVSLMPGLARLGPPDVPPPTPADVEASVPPDLRDRLPVRACKLKADGAMTTRTAFLREDYADAPGWRGLAVEDAEALRARVLGAHAAGWQVCTHAIGDAAVDAVLDALEAVEAADRGGAVAAGRHRIEHAMLLDDSAIDRAAALGAMLSMQPEFVAWAGDTYRARLGDVRAARMNRYRSILAAGIDVAFGSDRPVVLGAPLAGIAAAVRHAGPSGVALDPAERISGAEALHAWTAGAARASWMEGDLGRIAVGMRADLAILSSDPTAQGAWDGSRARPEVVATVVGGHVVHGDLA